MNLGMNTYQLLVQPTSWVLPETYKYLGWNRLLDLVQIKVLVGGQ